jgi:enoyl-CoA hydratase/carnithine racemase
MVRERIRNTPKIMVAKVAARCRRGRNEIALASDMCFIALGVTVFSQPEVRLGMVPGGGAT